MSEVLREDGSREPLLPGTEYRPGDVVLANGYRIEVASLAPFYSARWIAQLERQP
jgi:hypothetical protein